MNAISKQVPEITDTGIKGLDRLNEKQFFEVGKRLGKIEHGLQWAIGDWYNNIPSANNQYDGVEGKARACKRAKLEFETAKRCAQVAKTFSPGLRSPLLTFAHYKVLTHDDLDIRDAKRLLDRAAQGEGKGKKHKVWSSARLKRERDIFMGLAERPQLHKVEQAISSIADAVRKRMPPTASKAMIRAAVKAAEDVAVELKHEFTSEVDRRVSEIVGPEKRRIVQMRKDTQAEFERLRKIQRGVSAFLTKGEYQLIRSCLHPDREATPERKRKAFDAFSKLADVKNWHD